jgi:hypothetical protein
LAGIFFGAAGFDGLPALAGLAARAGLGRTGFAGFDGLALAGLAAGALFDWEAAAVFFEIPPDGWLRRFVGMGCSRVWRSPRH